VGLTRDVVLLPFDGDVERGEDLLDGFGHFGTDTVTGDEGYGVGSSVLGRDLWREGRTRLELIVTIQ
jgi:hypothetical protein